MVEPVEEASLDLVGQPAAVGGAERPLFGDQDAVRFPDALADRVPVHAAAIKPAQVDHLGVHSADPGDGLQDVSGHGQVAQDCSLRTRTAHRGPAHRQAEVPLPRWYLAGGRVEVDMLEYHHRVPAL